MAFTDMDEIEEEESGEMPPEESDNRNFIIIAAVLGGIMVIALLCTAAYAFFVLPKVRTDRQNAAATSYAQATMLAYEATQGAIEAQATPTKKPVVPTATNTPVLAQGDAANTPTATIDSVQATQDALFATVSAAQTQSPTSTSLPTSGFADDVGAPGLLAIAVVLVVVIFLVRRLRSA